MKKEMLIADSGGTKTDWCFVDDAGEKEFFTTESYHSRFLDHFDLNTEKKKWEKYTSNRSLELHFFGAGCLSDQNQQKMTAFFTDLGFRKVKVLSDIYGAGFALNDGEGWGAISGTGSVVFNMEKGKLKKIHGGLGRELGDEGSGYCFGKLVVTQIAAGQIRLSDFPELKEIELTPENYAQIPKLLSTYKENAQIREIHEENIMSFVKSYLDDCKAISFCGSYAFYHQDIFKDVLGKINVHVELFLERPIEKLVEFKIKSS